MHLHLFIAFSVGLLVGGVKRDIMYVSRATEVFISPILHYLALLQLASDLSVRKVRKNNIF